MTTFKKLTGFRFFNKSKYGWDARFNWGEVSGGLGLALELSSFEEHFSLHIHLIYPNLYITLPFLKRWHKEPVDIMDCWGFSLDTDSYSTIHLNWGNKTKIVHFPWDYDHHRTSHMFKDGTWYDELKGKSWSENLEAIEGKQWIDYLPYTYILESGEHQNRTATVTVSEMEWRQKWLKWTRLFAKVRRSIDVQFNDEVGERSGSWKGGTLGCGYNMQTGDTPLDTLRRMECERKF
jgi:hypothetical protein